MNADVVTLESFGDALRVICDFFANRADFNLHRGEPERECARVMFDKDTEETLDRAEQRAMHHERLVGGASFGNEFETEAVGKIESELYGGELPGTTEGVD